MTEINEEGAPEAGIGFTELREGRCKFPLGSFEAPPTRFCGDATPIGVPYCPKCQRKAYNRADRRR
jgi:hypothetical protein